MISEFDSYPVYDLGSGIHRDLRGPVPHGWHKRNRKWHYHHDYRSLCGMMFWIGKTFDVNPPVKKCCKKCFKKWVEEFV